MMSPYNPGSGICGALGGRKHILPAPLPADLGILLLKGKWEINLAKTVFEIVLVESPDFFQVSPQRLLDGFRENCQSILITLPISHHNLVIAKIDVFDSKPNALHQPKARTVKKT